MADRDCAQSGHHWHESDGAIFSRLRDQAKRDEIAVHCCWCEAATTKTGYGARIAATEPSLVKCGPHVTARES